MNLKNLMAKFYLDKEKDIVVKLFKSNEDELTYIIETPNHHTGNLITNLSKVAGVKTVKNEKENITMTKTIKINGMMCSHCTGRVGEVLNAIDGVSAEVSLDNGGQAVVTLAKDVSDDVLKKAVVDAGYEVVGIE